MPRRLIYTNYPYGNHNWQFMFLNNNNGQHSLSVIGGNFTEIEHNEALNFSSFEQSFFDQQGTAFARTIVADYATIIPMSWLYGLSEYKMISYCEVGALNDFIGADPVTNAIIMYPTALDVGLNLKAGKYLRADYQQAFAVALISYNAWIAKQQQLHNLWLQYKTVEHAVTHGIQEVLPITTQPVVVNVDTIDEQSKRTTESLTKTDGDHVKTPLRSKSFSFDLTSVGPSTSTNSDDETGYNSDSTSVNDMRRDVSMESLALVVSDWKKQDAAKLAAKQKKEETERAAAELAAKQKKEQEERVAEEAKKLEFTPVQRGSRAILYTNQKPWIKKSSPLSMFAFGAESESDDSSDEEETLKEAPVTPKPSVVVTEPKSKPKSKPKKEKPSDNRRGNKPLLTTSKVLTFSNQAPVSKPLEKKPTSTLVLVPVPATNSNNELTLMRKRATTLYERLSVPELSEERALSIARLCLFYFIAVMQNSETFEPGADARFVQRSALFMAQCMFAGVFLNVAVERLKQRNAPRLKLKT